MSDWLNDLAIKASGSGVGSLVALYFKRGHGGILTSFGRWLIGVWVGMVGTDAIISIAGWPEVPPFLLFVSSGLGVTGFMVIQFVLSPDMKAIIRTWLAKKDEAKNEP